MRTVRFMAVVLTVLFGAVPTRAESRVEQGAPSPELGDGTLLMRAAEIELARSQELVLEDFGKPYFIQYTIYDVVSRQLAGELGSLLESENGRDRHLIVEVRLGTPELDNTNFAASRFDVRPVALPIDQDELAIRQAIWRETDGAYKRAVQQLENKRSYLRKRNVKDPTPDFTPASPVQHQDAPARMDYQRPRWEALVRRLSRRFERWPLIQRSSVKLDALAGHTLLLNTEGTRLLVAETGWFLEISASCQADDGMPFSDRLQFVGERAEQLPALSSIERDLDDMVSRLLALREAPTPEEYSGPVWFDGVAGPQLFAQILADGLTAVPEPVGGKGMFGAQSPAAAQLAKKVGKRVLPRSYRVYDDPTVKKVAGMLLLGNYRYDSEGVPAARVELVKRGLLVGQLTSRVPTKKFSGSNGHGRRAGGRGIVGSVANLYVVDQRAVPSGQLKQRLMKAAREEGLERGLRVTALTVGAGGLWRGIGRGALVTDPLYAYTVDVKSGREQLVRGLEFGPATVKLLKRIVVSGRQPEVYHDLGTDGSMPRAPASFVAPAVIVEDLDLSQTEAEHAKPPILSPPLARGVR